MNEAHGGVNFYPIRLFGRDTSHSPATIPYLSPSFGAEGLEGLVLESR